MQTAFACTAPVAGQRPDKHRPIDKGGEKEMKKILVLIFVLSFVFGLESFTLAEKVTKIVGNKVTVMDDMGKEKTIEGNVKGLKVGDKVKLTVKDGRTWLNPQPEPPKPVQMKPADIENSVLQKKASGTPEAPPPPPPPKDGLKLK
jgi:hypothetical protein